MRNFMRKLLDKNITLKIVSLILAVFVWVYIVIVLNPPVERTIPVQIQLINHLSLDDLGYSIVSQSATETNVRVQGTRSVISRLTENDIIATVNLAYIDAIGTRSLPINISILVSDVSPLSTNPLAVNITVDETITVSREIEILTTGEISGNFVIGGISVTPNFVNITGPSTVVNDVTASVTLPLNGRVEDIYETLDIVFGSVSGREVPMQFLTFSILQAEVNAEILEVRTVPIVPNLGEYFVHQVEIGTYNLSVTPTTVTIIGSSAALEDITEISTTMIEISGSNGEGSRATASLVLPPGIRLRDEVETIEIILERVVPTDEPDEEDEYI